jgi:hypothetical protein
MDLFHTMYWSKNDGKYTEWASVYPGLAFFIVNVIGLPVDVGYADGFELRSIAGYSILIYLVMALVVPFYLVKSKLYKFSTSECILYYFFIITSFPYLFAIERGNIIILCLAGIPFLFSNNIIIHSLSLASLINIKPYFIIVSFARIRNLEHFVAIGVFTVLLFLIFGLLASEDFYLLFKNLLSFNNQAENFSLREIINYPSSLGAWSDFFRLLELGQVEVPSYVPMASLAVLLDIARYVSVLFAVYALIQDRLSDKKLAIILCIVLLTNFSRSAGGYSVIFMLAILPLVQDFKFSHIISALVALCILPLDAVPVLTQNFGIEPVYLSGIDADVDWSLGLGAVTRPFFNLFLLLALSVELIAANFPSTSYLHGEAVNA